VKEKHLHIVCFDVPYPVNHGGFFDLFYKLNALKHAGVHIHLHCFEYGRGQQPVLNQFCESVDYYPRRTGLAGISRKLPYIVSSRRNEELMKRLLQDDHPILLEGIHCTWPLNDERFAGRKIFVRLHNVEYEYYDQLIKTERSPIRRMYYVNESKLLKKYEAQIVGKAMFLAVAEKDAATYRENFNARVEYLPVFLPWEKIESVNGQGQFCLYHGNLSVAENDHAAIWLLREVFHELKTPFVIAGKDPSRRLQQLVNKSENVCLVANPSGDEMQDLVKKAHINILPAFNTTGVKLKLLNALFVGRHCIANAQAVKGTGLEVCCHIAEKPQEIKQAIQNLLHQEFTSSMIADRGAVLSRIYNNQENCNKLTGKIW
jgi:hypothetical protein